MKLLFFCSSLFLAGLTFAQGAPTSKMQQKVTVDYVAYLHVIYEIKDLETPDPDVLVQIPFDVYNQYRLGSQDVEILDPVTGYTVILYSEEKCATLKH